MTPPNSPEGNSSPGENLSETQKHFVGFVVAKAGVEFEGNTAATVYDVIDDSLLDHIIFEQQGSIDRDQPDSVAISYSDGIDQVDIYKIEFATDGTPSQKEEPFEVMEGGNADFGISDELVERKLAKLKKIDEQGRLKSNPQATKEYRRLHLSE